MALGHTNPSSDRKTEKARPAFLYQSVLGALRSRMNSGAFAGNTRLPGLKQIAAEFDVSVMTVRRALDVLEQEGHVERLPGVGVFARPSAQTEQGGLAFVSTFLDSPFHTGIATGTQRAGQRIGRPVFALDGHFDAELEMQNINRLPCSGIAGAVVLPPFRHPATLKALQALHRSGFPMVVVDMTLPGVHTDFVTSDHETAAYEGTMHLLTRRAAQTIFLTHPPVASSVLQRIQGYERALWDFAGDSAQSKKAWIDADEQAVGFEQNRRWWGGYHAILPLLRESRGPLSILATDAYAGWGVYKACHELGLDIPRDVSVLSFDEAECAVAMTPPMSVIAQSVEKIGEVAVDLLMRRIESERLEEGPVKTFRHVVVSVRMIERASVAPLTATA